MKSGFFGMLGAFCLIIVAIVLGDSEGFFNVPSLVVCIFLPIGLTIASAGHSDLGRAVLSLRCLFGSPPESDLTVRNAQVLRHMISYAYAAGVIGSMIGWIQFLRQLDGTSPVGKWISVSLLTLFYAVIIAECILRPAARRVETTLNNQEDLSLENASPQIDLADGSFQRLTVSFRNQKTEQSG